MYDAYLGFFFFVEVFCDDDIELFIFFDFTGVIGIENILHDQKVDAEMCANVLYVGGILQSAYLEPMNIIGTFCFRNEDLKVVFDVLINIVGVITEQMQSGGSHVLAVVAETIGKKVVVCIHRALEKFFW